MANVLIVGISGFCARHLASRLREIPGMRLFGAGRRGAPPALAGIERYWPIDARDADQVRRLVREARPDLIFNLAGVSSGPAPDVYGTNLMAAVHLLEAVRLEAPGARTLLVGSAAEYGEAGGSEAPLSEEHPCRPVGAFGISKHAMTLAGLEFARTHGLQVVVARPFNAIGAGIPPTLLLGALIQRIKEAKASGSTLIRTGPLEGRRDFVAVEDVADGFVRLLSGDTSGQVFNLCSGQSRSARDLLDLLIASSGIAVRAEVDPALERTRGIRNSVGDPAKAMSRVGFRLRVPVEEAVRRSWAEATGAGP